MKWVPDTSGRFDKRPHYSPGELDDECEAIITKFLLEKYRKIEYPIKTDDLVGLLEQDANLDQFADLTSQGAGDIWGETDFSPGEKPLVRINSKLSSDLRFENPFRTTLTHEFTHVRLHGFLFAEKSSRPTLFGPASKESHSCRREQIETIAEYDWAEWQAAYCSGALLMPRTAIRALAADFAKRCALSASRHHVDSAVGQQLIDEVAKGFGVSAQAAKVRLSKLGFIAEGREVQRTLLT
jgi:Zn-dependent peptidase ImmA (M78 family)